MNWKIQLLFPAEISSISLETPLGPDQLASNQRIQQKQHFSHAPSVNQFVQLMYTKQSPVSLKYSFWTWNKHLWTIYIAKKFNLRTPPQPERAKLRLEKPVNNLSSTNFLIQRRRSVEPRAQ